MYLHVNLNLQNNSFSSVFTYDNITCSRYAVIEKRGGLSLPARREFNDYVNLFTENVKTRNVP